MPPPGIDFEYHGESFSSNCTALYGLVIGIDSYRSRRLTGLQGAVSDAEAFAQFLNNQLNIPYSQIQVLINEEANRAAIIGAFTTLRDDVRIKKGDPIFIFYAGHGGEAKIPVGWEAGGFRAKIQTLMPQDFSDEPGKEVLPIPDYTIAALLNQIAKKKGDNITVVLDCCFAASLNRAEHSPNIVRRSANLPPEYVMPMAADEDIWGATGTQCSSVDTQFLHLGFQSYVLLSACQSFEYAQESDGHGMFSSALLTLLRTNGIEKLRYSDVISLLGPIPNQNPQCDGLHKDRFLFNNKVAIQKQKFYTIVSSPDDPTKFVMDGGLVHGLSVGAEFSVFSQTHQKIGYLRLAVLQPFASTMTSTANHEAFHLGPKEKAYALQTKPGVMEALRLYINPANDEVIKNLLFHCGADNEEPLWQHVRLVDTVPEDAHIVLSMDNGQIALTDSTLERYGICPRTKWIDPNSYNIDKILRGICRYFWNLERGDNALQLFANLTVDFYKLNKSDTVDYEYHPIGENLYRNGAIELLVSDNKNDNIYGIKLTNNTGRNLYPNLFYYESFDFSIESYYTSPPFSETSANAMPLVDNGTLTLGYGSGGCPPWVYYLRPGEDIDVGFLKLFVFTEATDLSDVPQLPPLLAEPRVEHKALTQRRIVPERLWSTLVIPVIQHRLIRS